MRPLPCVSRSQLGLAAVRGAAALSFTGVLGLAAVVTRLAATLALAGVLTLAGVGVIDGECLKRSAGLNSLCDLGRVIAFGTHLRGHGSAE